MNKIKILDETTISKIAAGEIVERPASVVKELVENSIDANAKNIVIEIKNGGKSYIRVTDDGNGIPPDQIDLAFKRHSTSKIQNINDLNKTLSLGFRGEALASISAISKVEILTKIENKLKGTQANLESGKITNKNVVGCPKGTTIIVKDIFYNVPVRRNFLKSNATESNHISDVVYKLALGNPQISFSYIKDNKAIIKTPGNNDVISNIYLLLGEKFVQNLLEINYKDDLIKVYGYISKNNFYRSNRNHQYIFINKRYVKNQYISKFIESKYKSLIPSNKFPVFILFIDIDPLHIDVNIHPTKQEIKFKNQELIDIAINFAIDLSINRICHVPTMDLEEKKAIDKEYENISFLNKLKKDTDFNKNFVANTIKNNKEDKKIFQNLNESTENYTYKNNKIQDKNNGKEKFSIDDLRIVGIVFNTYIIVENLKDDMIYLIDQHAAHERVMYEKYRNEYKSEEVVIQKLIAPKILTLTNKEMNLIKQNTDLLHKLGFEIEEFGLNTIALRGVPILFGKPNHEDILLDIIDNLDSSIKTTSDTYEVKIEKIMKIACSKAIKSGDKISDIEVYNLLKLLNKTNNPYTCPHGRPTVIKITKTHLEKQFKRIM